MSKTTAEPKIVAVHLVKPHRHAGRDYKPGTEDQPTVLRLREDKADWLIAQRVAVMPPAEPTTAAAKSPPPAAATSTTKPKE